MDVDATPLAADFDGLNLLDPFVNRDLDSG